MMEDPSSGNDGRSIDAAVPFRELPGDHLFHLVYEAFDDPDDYYVGRREQIDWNAVTQRLMTPNGVLEARQWVDMGRGRWGSTKLLLHLVCDSGTGRTAGSEIGEQYLRAVIRTIEVYPEVLHFPDDRGFYPLHLLCGNGCFHRFWNDTTADLARQVFKSVLFGNPEAAKVQTVVHQMTPLHCFIGSTSMSSRGSAGELEALEMLLDVFPDALRLRDVLDCLPLHHACGHRNFLVVKTLLDAYPEAIQLFRESRSCLQECLRFCQSPVDYDVARLLLEACPWFLANDDGERCFGVHRSDQIVPSGDVLDYVYFHYWNGLELWRYKSTSEEGFQYVQYFQSNVAFLDGRQFPVSYLAGTRQILERTVSEEYIEATFDMIVRILLTMYGRDNRASPLHSAVYGSLCRPWNLAVFKEVVSRFGDEAQQADRNGNLPLHLFLKSCMIQRERAIEKHFVGNGEEYEDAVARSLRILLGAHADAAAKTNGDGRLPLHLALDHLSLSFETAVAPLLDLAPRLLLTCDTKTGLYPFMNAAVGANANVDMTYRLLRRDPTALLQGTVPFDDSTRGRRGGFVDVAEKP